MRTLLWFRQCLRLDDNPALIAACAQGEVIPVYIWSPDEELEWAPGAASRVWLHTSLIDLDARLRARGSRLTLRQGDSLRTLLALAAECEAQAIFWNRRYEPAVIERDSTIKTALRESGLEARSFNAQLLFEPHQVSTKQNTPFKVFTPFWRTCLALPEPQAPQPAPQTIVTTCNPKTLKLAALQLEPLVDWATGIRGAWQPGESGAAEELDVFLEGALNDYLSARDMPATMGVSRLSPHLHFGEIGPRQIWHAAKAYANAHGGELHEACAGYLRQLGWREFAHHLLYHFPHTPTKPLQVKFDKFPWRHNAGWLAAWQQGRTGYPLVDAGMRELWATGYMHNRVRMVVASFLVKHLLIHWREGAQWFWDTLVDADLANNTLGWQWTSGCGADAAPYFRIFNPMTQGERFDPQARYVRRWVPELERLPDKWIHKPFLAPEGELSAAGVLLGGNYPKPLVDHAHARQNALAALATLKQA